MTKMNVWKSGMIRTPKDIWRHIKWSYQRVVRGFCDYDAYDLDVYYLDLLIASLKHFKKHTHTYPGRGDYGKTSEDWDRYLEAIIVDLEFVQRNAPGFLNESKVPYKVVEKRLARAMSRLVNVWFELWD